ncbi:MAG: hypothetical protein N3G76_02680 [Candidatus Micrarchaeota archaeon]|nr:hypothetical protein [Candidatus Micrarchaeota archaeon]
MVWIPMLTVLWDTAAQNFARNLPLEWYGVSMLVIMVIAFSLILMFMVSRIFQVHSLESTIKRELFQLGATAIMITLLLGIQQSTDKFLIAGNTDLRDMISEKAAEELLGKKGFEVNIFDVSYVYLISVQKCLKKTYEGYLNDQSSEILSRISMTVDVLGNQIPLPLAPLYIPMWKSLMTSIMRAEDVLWLSIATYFQINFLQWIEAAMVTVYLPIGILLRSIPFTRGGGAAIMAIAISLYFVYPFLLTILFFNGPPLPPACSVSIEAPDEGGGTAVKPPKVCPNDPTAVEAYFGSGSGSAGSTGSSLQKMDVSGFDAVRMYAYYFPFVAFVGAVLFGRSLAQVLGGNISDIGRGMVRVI